MFKKLFLPLLILTSLSSCGLSSYNDLFKITTPDYIAYSPSTSSFIYDYVVEYDKFSAQLDFISSLSFKEISENDYNNSKIDYYISFIYIKEKIQAFSLSADNYIFYKEDETFYSSTLNNFTSIEIIDFLIDNGEKIDIINSL